MFPLFFLFVVLPIAEIMLLINVSSSIGGWNTFLIVIVTAAFGAYFVRQQGFSLIQQIQHKINAGQAPSSEMAEAVLLLIAGVMLITPGFITDGLGFLFTLPFSRAPIANFLMSKVKLKQAGNVHFTQTGFNQHEQHQSTSQFQDGETIDGEYTDKSPSDDKNRLN